MRGPDTLAVAVRRPDGSILVEKQSVPPWTRRCPFLRWPLVRGVVALVEALVVGVQTLVLSANLVAEEPDQELGRGETAVALLLAVGVAVLLFVVIPAVFGQWSARHFGVWGQNVLEGLLRLALFLLYLRAISHLNDIRRLFAYHGAEHKVIHAWEAGAALKAAAAGEYSCLHPRCGTSFVLIVFVLAVLFHCLFNPAGLAGRIGVRVAMLPVLAAVGYELLKWSSRNVGRRPVKLLIAPGLWLQKLTTREPDAAQLEVAIEALKAVLSKSVAATADQSDIPSEQGLVAGVTPLLSPPADRQVSGDVG